MSFRNYLAILFHVLVIFPILGSVSAETSPFKIPQLKNIQIDGHDKDWMEKGFAIEVMTGERGDFLPINDFSQQVRLAWDQDGLLVFVLVKDDQIINSNDGRRLKQGDYLELWLADKVGSRNYYSVCVAPGKSNSSNKARYDIRDTRRFRDHFLLADIETGKKISKDGYQIELKIPWSRLGIKPSMGQIFALQIFMADVDADSTPEGQFLVSWFPDMTTPRDLTKLFPLQLSDKAGENYNVQVHRKIKMNSCSLNLVTTSEYVGHKIKVYSGDDKLISSLIQKKDGRGIFTYKYEVKNDTKYWQDIEIMIDNEVVSRFPKTTQVDYILNRYITSSGYTETRTPIKSRKYTGEIIHDLSYKNPPIERIPIEIGYLKDSGWRAMEYSDDGIQIEAFDGIRGWSVKNDSLIRVENNPLNELYLLLQPDLPLNFTKLYPEVEFLEKKFHRNDWVYVLKCKSIFGKTSNMRFNVETGLLQGIGIYDLKDYRNVDGVMVPFRIFTDRKGGSTNFVFENVEDNRNEKIEPIQFPMELVK